MHKDTCVVVPIYNEESVITDVINDLSKYFSNIICVDDGSTDDSANEVIKTPAQLIRHFRNSGQGTALRTGLDAALSNGKINYFVTFDADGQHSPADADRMVRYMKAQPKIDVVLGSRFLGEVENIDQIKLFVLKTAIIVSNLTCGLKLTDTHNGLRVFNRQFTARLHLKSHGMVHASEIIYKVARGGYSYKELPVTIRYTDYSKAKGQSVLNSFAILAAMLKHKALGSWRV